MLRDENGNTLSPEHVERVVITTFRSGRPVYFSLPCPDCGAPIWFRCTPDGIAAVQAGEDTPRAHGEGDAGVEGEQ